MKHTGKKVLSLFMMVALVLGLLATYTPISAEAASTTKYVTASSLNIRSGAGTNYKVVTTAKKNQAVTVTQTKGFWDQVKINNKTGWASNQYLTTKNPTSTPTIPNTSSVTKYVTASTLNVRSGAGTSYKVMTTVKKNQAVTVTQTSGSWSKITVSGKIGWVSSQYLTSTKPVSTPDIVTQVNGLKTIGSNQQLILVTTSGYGTYNAQIRTFEKDASGKWKQVLNTTGYIGKYGFASQKDMQEGGKKSPTGKYTIGTTFGTPGNPGTKMTYRKITSDDVWVDDSTSKLYNTWQSKSKTQGQWKSAENMNIAAYKYGFVINYNTARTPYKGSVIFFHISSGYTLGCTGTSESNVVSILKWLNPSKNPVIIQTPMAELGNY